MPYGVYDLAANSGWVSVGVDHDTAAFAVNSIRQWWQAVGRARYPNATRLLITADGGGSNGSRVRLWKRELQKLANELGLDIVVNHLPPGTSKWNKIGLWKRELQKLANELGLDITVSHLPPGTSKWNKIEHRLFSFISQNWRAKPLVSYRVIVELISATTTQTAPCAANSTPANIPAALSYRMPRWPPSTSNAPSSTASGTTPSHQMPIAQIARLSRDGPLPLSAGSGCSDIRRSIRKWRAENTPEHAAEQNQLMAGFHCLIGEPICVAPQLRSPTFGRRPSGFSSQFHRQDPLVCLAADRLPMGRFGPVRVWLWPMLCTRIGGGQP